MNKTLCLLAITTLLLAACGGENVQQAPVEVTIEEFNANTADFVGKTLVLTGIVDHVCKHGGKRMFVMGTTPDERVKIEAGEVGSFDVALEGSEVRVEGVVMELRIDDAYLDNWEEEACSEESRDMAKVGQGGGEEEAHDGEHEKTLEQIESMRQKLADSGKDYLGYYHLECVSFRELNGNGDA
jgi:hypothetical protein